jgi:hypothetical protein
MGEFLQCRRCGCTKPCRCDGYTPNWQSLCSRCGCTKPCGCDLYTRRDDHMTEGRFDYDNTYGGTASVS